MAGHRKCCCGDQWLLAIECGLSTSEIYIRPAAVCAELAGDGDGGNGGEESAPNLDTDGPGPGGPFEPPPPPPPPPPIGPVIFYGGTCWEVQTGLIDDADLPPDAVRVLQASFPCVPDCADPICVPPAECCWWPGFRGTTAFGGSGGQYVNGMFLGGPLTESSTLPKVIVTQSYNILARVIGTSNGALLREMSLDCTFTTEQQPVLVNNCQRGVTRFTNVSVSAAYIRPGLGINDSVSVNNQDGSGSQLHMALDPDNEQAAGSLFLTGGWNSNTLLFSTSMLQLYFPQTNQWFDHALIPDSFNSSTGKFELANIGDISPLLHVGDFTSQVPRLRIVYIANGIAATEEFHLGSDTQINSQSGSVTASQTSRLGSSGQMTMSTDVLASGPSSGRHIVDITASWSAVATLDGAPCGSSQRPDLPPGIDPLTMQPFKQPGQCPGCGG